MIRVLLADDEALFRGGLRMLLEAQDDLEVVAEVTDGAQAVARTLELVPDVVLMDLQMPVLDGLSALAELARRGSPAKVLVLTTFDLDRNLYEALRAGAAGFFLKSARPARLVEAVRAVADGDELLDPALTHRLLARWMEQAPAADQARLAHVTEREREVLALVGRGLTNKEIAGQLFVAESTVKTHVVRLLTKTRSRDRVQLVILAHDLGLRT
ncbi:response regulator [Ornithinimicrobium avium]|uniref:DNA-binding response regulator n=1 Tax=Ornithinimicrobium avium TaxID=2283195 RepID=A0A345NN46_9MICO|nr:response regulator transcription factor [Ornithinimicrobium avium]AXH96454.1 DNA-binding response regulator [Ornithinimicrobium avium]